MDTIESALTADAIVRTTTGSGFAADAIRMKPRDGSISAAATKWRVMFSSRTIDALIAPGRRNTHDRGTPPHYDNDLDTFIVLSKALGVYQQGMDLHAVLTAVADRVSVLEARL